MRCVHARHQHLAVGHRVQAEEGFAETGRERGHRLGDTALGAGELGGKAREEVILVFPWPMDTGATPPNASAVRKITCSDVRPLTPA